jgi:hypothetical protein
MITEDAVTDLKQFIVATMSQQMSSFATKDDLAQFATKDDLAGFATKDDIAQLDSKIDAVETRLSQKIDNSIAQVHQDIADLQGFIGNAIDTSNNAHHEQLKNHEKRIVRLKHKLA